MKGGSHRGCDQNERGEGNEDMSRKKDGAQGKKRKQVLKSKTFNGADTQKLIVCVCVCMCVEYEVFSSYKV